MKIKKQARHQAKMLFRECLADGVLDEDRVREVVRVLSDRKPRHYVATLSHFARLVKLELARRSAHIESATPLDPRLQTEVKDKLSRMYGPGLSFTFNTSPALLGGLRIQVGSDVFDNSVRARLDRLDENF